MELLKLYMDDGFIYWTLKLNFENFKACLNNMHPSIKCTFIIIMIIYIIILYYLYIIMLMCPNFDLN